MAKVPLQGMTLNMLADGYAGKLVDECLSELVKDIAERGHDGKARKLVIEYTFTPKGAQVSVDVEASTKVPKRGPLSTETKYDRNAGSLMFNPDCSDNPDQMTIGDNAAAK